MRGLQKHWKTETPAMIDYLFYNYYLFYNFYFSPYTRSVTWTDSHYEKTEKTKWFPVIV